MPKEWDQDPEQELELDPKLRWELERIEAEADEEYPDWRRRRRALVLVGVPMLLLGFWWFGWGLFALHLTWWLFLLPPAIAWAVAYRRQR